MHALEVLPVHNYLVFVGNASKGDKNEIKVSTVSFSSEEFSSLQNLANCNELKLLRRLWDRCSISVTDVHTVSYLKGNCFDAWDTENLNIPISSL